MPEDLRANLRDNYKVNISSEAALVVLTVTLLSVEVKVRFFLSRFGCSVRMGADDASNDRW